MLSRSVAQVSVDGVFSSANVGSSASTGPSSIARGPFSAGSLAFWMWRDTLAQARATGLVWFLGTACLLGTLLAASVHVTGDAVPGGLTAVDEFLPAADRDAGREAIPVVAGELALGWGGLSLPLGRDRADAVRFLQTVLAVGLADTLGLLLALVWTAGFLPSFVAERHAAVLFTKPSGRAGPFLAKYLAVVALVAGFAALFVGGTWTALGCRTGIWASGYWWCLPLVVCHFAVFYAFSAALAVLTRNTAACVLGTLGFWLVAWGANYGWHALSQHVAEGVHLASGWGRALEVVYVVLPKPADFSALLNARLDAGDFFAPVATGALGATSAVDFGWSVGSSALFALVTLAAATHALVRADY